MYGNKGLTIEKYERMSRVRMALGTITAVLQVVVLALIIVLAVLIIVLAVLMIGAATAPAPVSGESAETVRYTESAGTTGIAETSPAAYERDLPDVVPVVFEPSEDVPLDPELQWYVFDACRAYDVPESLVLALIEHESGFDPWVYSADGCNFGLMQINNINYGWLRESGIEPLRYPGNIEAGVLMLGTLLDKYADPHKALMAYNAGESGAKRLWGQGIYTSAFSRSVLAAAEKYEKE
jgi:hypothetical protein